MATPTRAGGLRPSPSEWRYMQMRGGLGFGRRFTAHRADVDEFEARPWWRKCLPGGTNLERWLHKRYGDVIYRGGSYDRSLAAER